MANHYFKFKKFVVEQDKCAMKVCTDSCLLGAFAANKIELNGQPHISVLDVGGGTGLLSLMMAQKCEGNIYAVEMDQQAYEQMAANFKSSPWSNRLHPIHADIRSWPPGDRYDFIISNPPFFEKDLKGSDSTKILAMHDSGLLLSELISSIRNRLQNDGLFCLMVPFFRQEYLMDLLDASGMTALEILNIRQTSSHKPFRSIVFGNLLNAKVPVRTSMLTIRENDEYSSEFKNLLRDYYLKHM